MLANACEWYEYIVYASLAPILSVVFFPNDDRIVRLMLVFGIFAAGFLVRPLGGIIFSTIADKYGRKKALVYSILVLALPTLGVSLLPGFDTIGHLAPILLLLSRLLQGLAIGGEYPTLLTYIAELSPPDKRGYIGSFASVTTVVGVLLATATVAVLNLVLTHAQLISFGWRIPFVAAFVVIVVSYFIRLKLPESQIFLSAKDLHKYPVIEAIKNSPLEIVTICGYTICIAIAYYTFNVFSTTYFTQTLKLDYLTALYINMSSMLFLIVLLPVAGSLSDKHGRIKTTLIAIIAMLILILPVYAEFEKHMLWLAIMAQFMFATLIALYLAPLPALIAEQSSTKTRCSVIALGYNLALALFGGTAPVVNMYLITYFSTPLAPSFYLMASALISLIAALAMKDLTGKLLT